MKKIFFGLMLSFSLIFAMEQVDGIAAKVGREVILESDLKKEIMQLQSAGMYKEDMKETDLLNQMIESKLIVQKAKEENYEFDELEINKKVNARIDEITKKVGSKEALRKEIKKNGLTLYDLKNYFRDMLIEENLRNQIMSEEIRSKIYVTDIEQQEYYQNHISDIPLRPEVDEIGMIMKTISAGEETKKKSLKKINEVMDKIVRGEDFAELAKMYSDCPSSEHGGDLGFFGKGAMVPAFEKAAFSLRVNEISDIVETNFGYHIIKMEEKDGKDIRVKHILVQTEATEEDVKNTVDLMNNVKKNLEEGADFSDKARIYSEDSSSEKGGIIGEFPRDKYPEMFKESIIDLKPGEYSEVIREGDVLYIFAKLRTIPERPYKYEEIAENIKEMVTVEKQRELYAEWVKKLKKENYVEILYKQ